MVLEEQTDVPLVKKWLSLYDTAEYPKGIPYYTDLAELLRENDGKIFRVYESVLLTKES